MNCKVCGKPIEKTHIEETNKDVYIHSNDVSTGHRAEDEKGRKTAP